MARLEDLAKGVVVRGVAGDAPVTVRSVEWHGNMCLTLTYKTADGVLGETMLYRTDEPHLALESSSKWAFDADADDLKLASEAYRIHLAHLFDPYLAVRTSAIDPLPHQMPCTRKCCPRCRSASFWRTTPARARPSWRACSSRRCWPAATSSAAS